MFERDVLGRMSAKTVTTAHAGFAGQQTWREMCAFRTVLPITAEKDHPRCERHRVQRGSEATQRIGQLGANFEVLSWLNQAALRKETKSERQPGHQFASLEARAALASSFPCSG